jgi:ELWxxDGT repeat protein
MGLEQLDSNTLLYLGDSSIHSGVDLWFTVNISTGQVNMVCEDCYPWEVTAYTAWRGNIYFTAKWSTGPASLWVTDGTETGTHQILEPSTGLDFTNPDDFLSAGSNLFFVTEDGRYGVEPWVFHIAVNDRAYLPAILR